MMNFFRSMPGNLQNPDDLMINQRGEISESQNAVLSASVGWQTGCTSIVLAFFFMPFFFVFASVAFSVFTESWVFALVLVFMILLLGGLILSQAGGLLTTWKRWNALKRDRENRAIRQGQGQLAFLKNRYAVQAGGRELILPNSTNAGGLKPGTTYRFYFLEESGFVLSAEEVFAASPSQARNAIQEFLATANKFSMQDLELNRNNEISSAQRNKALPSLFLGMLIGGLPLIFGLLLFSGKLDTGGETIALLVPAIFLAVFALAGGAIFVRGALDLFAQAPLVAEGEGRKEKRVSRGRRNRKTTYYYAIDGTLFEVSKSGFEALVDGERYRVYALPHTKRLLTIEPL
jgi:hypothetical protein